MDGELFHVDGGVREIGYAVLAGILLSLYVVWALRKPVARDRGRLRSELRGRHASLAVMAFLGLASAVGIACFASPEVVDYAFREYGGGVFESIAAGSFLSVFLLGGIYGLFSWDRSPVNLGLMVLGLGGFLDEVSYGMRLFEVRPRIFGGIHIDGLHDILEWAWRGQSITPLAGSTRLIIFLAITVSGAALAVWWMRGPIAGAVRACASSPAIWYVPWILILGIGSCAIDFGAWGMAAGRVRNIGPFVEESLEMGAALSLCYAWYAHRRSARFERSAARRPMAHGGATESPARLAA